jgi:hypothetical protein
VVSASGVSLSPRGRQSFAPLTAPRLGQVLERGSLCFEPMEDLGGSPTAGAVKPPWKLATYFGGPYRFKTLMADPMMIIDCNKIY